MTKEEKVEALISFISSLKPFDNKDAQKSEFASRVNSLVDFVKDTKVLNKNSILDTIEVTVESLIKKFEPVIDSFEFRRYIKCFAKD